MAPQLRGRDTGEPVLAAGRQRRTEARAATKTHLKRRKARRPSTIKSTGFHCTLDGPPSRVEPPPRL